MKKYINGEYVELTEAGIVVWEESQQLAQSFTPEFELIFDIVLEESGLIEPITDIDYSSIKIEMSIPSTNSAQRICIGLTGKSSYSGYLGNTLLNDITKIIYEADSKKNEGYPQILLLSASTWVGKWQPSYGSSLVPKRINQINIGLSDLQNVEFPAGTTIKIYAKE